MLDQHIRFADKFFECLNATESAVYAGFAEATAKQEGWRLLQRDDVQEYLGKLRSEYTEKSGVSKQKVIAELARIAFSDIRNYYTGDNQLIPITDLDDDAAAALASLKIDELYNGEVTIGQMKEIKTYNKLDALEKLARHLGLYEKDNEQSKGATQVTIFELPNNGRNIG